MITLKDDPVFTSAFISITKAEYYTAFVIDIYF